MNPVLVEAIRVRMREQTTEQLLELWTTNDRAMWSPEAFEAIRSLLAERGVKELPRQNDPAPLADRHAQSGDPVVQYWMGWLRPILWIGVGTASLALVTQVARTLELWDQVPASMGGVRRLTALAPYLTTLVLSVWLLIGCVGCFRLIPAARLVLLIFAWVAVGFGVLSVVRAIVTAFQTLPLPESTWSEALTYAMETVLSHVYGLILPAVLLVFLRRPEIRSLFIPPAGPGV